MAFDTYAPCPGGRDKKIRFCCPEMTKELEKIHDLMEKGQTAACLNFLEQLEGKHPDCACLVAAKLAMLRQENRYTEALPIAKAFVEREPENMLALSELALATAAGGELKAALHMLIDAFEKGNEGELHSALLLALYVVGAQLAMIGQVIPAIAIGHQLRTIPSMQQQASTLIYQAMSIPEIPLIIRETHIEQACPTAFPKKAEFEAAVRLLVIGHWKKGLAALEALTPHAASWPMLWKNIALLRLWLMEEDAAVAALDAFCAYADQDFEELADTQFLRYCLVADPLGDRTEILAREYAVTQPEEALEKLFSTPNLYMIDFDPRQLGDDDNPPPKNVFLLLDRPFPAPGTAITLDTAASQLATCLYFGKQTDRPARLEIVEMLASSLVQVDNFLRNTLGSMLGPVGDPQPTRMVSSTEASIQYRFRFKPDIMPDAEQLETLVTDFYEKHFIETFLNTPLGVLDEKSPLMVAGDKTYRAKLLGALELIDNWMNPEIAVAVGNKLRERLGLPIPGPIAVPEGDLKEAEVVKFLESVPVWRWYRFEIEKMSTDMLLRGLRMVEIVQEPRALIRFSEELLARPMKSMPPEARFLAFNTLIRVAQSERNLEEALLWIDRAKNECAELQLSPAAWKIASIGVYLGMGKMQEAQEVIQDVIARHGNEPEAMQMLQELFVGLGLMNPDGTPRGPQQAAPAPPGTQAVQAPGTSQPAPRPESALWTPDGEAPKQSGGSKLWTPD